MPIGSALGIDAGAAYGLVVIAALLLPETKGRRLAEAGSPGHPHTQGEQQDTARVANPSHDAQKTHEAQTHMSQTRLSPNAHAAHEEATRTHRA
jgi:hypothetical protein